jgi:polar amino acid transport system ATP-binding protein
MLKLREFGIIRGSHLIVGPLELSVSSGRIVTLMGPSGIGNTTLLLALLGFHEEGISTSGNRYFRDTRLAAGQILPKALYIPQTMPFNPNWEIGRFLCKLPFDTPPTPRGAPRNNKKQRVAEVLESLNLGHRFNATVGELSGGEVQRAALAQAILLKPAVLVGDEFVSALDPGMTLWVLEQCRTMVDDFQGIAVLALHDVNAALLVSDSIVVLVPREDRVSTFSLSKESSAWRPDVIHTYLVLLRLASQKATSDSQCVVEMFSQYIQQPELFLKSHSMGNAVRTYMITRSGQTVIESHAESRLLGARRGPGSKYVTPIEGLLGSKEVIGFTIPFEENGLVSFVAERE